MHIMLSALTKRMDKLESGIEQCIANKVARTLVKRVHSGLSWIRKDIDNHLDTFKESLKADIDTELDDMNNSECKPCWFIIT